MVDLVANYGGVGDGQFYTSAVLTISVGTKNLHCSTPIWAAGDVGKNIRVGGAGQSTGGGTPAALVLVSTIDTFTDSQNVILHDNAISALSAASSYISWGTDNSGAITAFNSANAGASNITLTAPAGKFFITPTGGGGVTLGAGVRSMTFAGAGVGSTYLIGAVQFGGGGIQPFGDTSARVATVQIGASTATLLNVSDASRFSPPQWCVLASVDLQGSASFPPNNVFWDYVQVTAINGVSGLVTFDRAVANFHKSTYPLFDPGLGVKASPGSPHNCAAGGPATLFILNPTWDIQATFQDFTFVGDPGQGTNSNGRVIRFLRCAGPDQGPVVSTNMQWSIDTSNFPAYGVEVDKMIDSMVVSNSTFSSIFMQSASPRSGIFTGNTIANLSGGGVNIVSSGNTFSNIGVGVGGFGVSNSWSSTSDSLATITPGGALIPDVTIYGLQNGIISYPLGSGPVRWAVPGCRVFFTGGNPNEGNSFVVTDIGTDGNAVYASLTIGSGSAVLSSAIALWSLQDVGKPIRVNGAGASAAPLVTTIAGFTDSSHITLGAAAATALVASTQYVVWGSNLIYTRGPLINSWPNLLKTGGGLLGLQGAPVNSGVTFSNCTGCPDAIDLSQAPANRPLYSYTKRTYNATSWGTGVAGVQPTLNLWGAFTTININVTKAYTGAQSTCILTALARGIQVQLMDGSMVTWDIKINMKVAGLRTVTPGNIVGLQSGDSIPGKNYAWFPGTLAPYLETDISGDATATWPTVTIEVISDQGFFPPVVMPLRTLMHA
jgi:hypothetical protein